MRSLSASDLLEIWERGAGRTPVEQAWVILEYALPEASAAWLAQLTIGQRDAYLLQLREQTFGHQLRGLSSCPGCGEGLEISFSAKDFQAPDLLLPDPEAEERIHPAETSLSLTPYEVTFRLPTSGDLNVMVGWKDASLARQHLLEACLISARNGSQDIPARDLPADVLEAIMAQMSQADPLADLTIAVTCPTCGHPTQIVFDIVAYFWSEISAWAARLLHEVHLLASAYGWREADILAMSAWRRQRYLELIGL